MSSKLFAFQLSRPAELTEPMSREYDPQTQTMVWQGGPSAQGGVYYCSSLIGGPSSCTTKGRGAVCFTSQDCVPYGWICDTPN
jgi:hypothetical protein